MTKDYYKILGVERNATKEEIKRAYKKLAKQYHPDLNKESGATERFKEINEAAAVLGDDKKREMYDRYGTSTGGFAGGSTGFNFSDFMEDIGNFGFDFDNIFESFFGGRRRAGPHRGGDLGVSIQITLEEAFAGIEKELVIPRTEHCAACRGTGAASPTDIINCQACNGSGYVTLSRNAGFAMFTTRTTCRQCHGEGRMIRKACEQCDGEGMMQKTRKLEIKVPAGIESGMQLRIPHEGEAGEKGGSSGDLYVQVQVEEHEVFERRGHDLYCQVPISFTQAALGADIRVEALSGKTLTVSIPPETQTHTVFRIRGEGMPSVRGGAGDLKIQVIVQTPTKMSRQEKELLRELATLKGEEIKKGFFEKLKKG